jgi:hypothetical protein
LGIDMLDRRADIRGPFKSLDNLLNAVKNSATPDKNFEVAWLPADEVCEGSRLRGFLTVQIVGFEQDLANRA